MNFALDFETSVSKMVDNIPRLTKYLAQRKACRRRTHLHYAETQQTTYDDCTKIHSGVAVLTFSRV